jgi:hypothetical protein
MRFKNSRIQFSASISFLCGLAGVVGAYGAESQAPIVTERATVPVSADNELSSATMVAVDKGLAWLAQMVRTECFPITARTWASPG